MSGAPKQNAAVQKAATPPTTAVAKRNATQALAMKSLDDLMRISEIMLKGGMAQGCGKTEAVACKILAGVELGLTPAQAMASIYIVNGKPSLYGDAVPGLAISSGLMDGQPIEKEIGTKGQDTWGWSVTVKRRHHPEAVTRTFTVADAKQAGLWDPPKGGPWKSFPSRMLLFRARGFAYRDTFPDVYSGVAIIDEDSPSGKAEPIQVEATVTSATANEPTQQQLPPAPQQSPMPAPNPADSPKSIPVDGIPMVDEDQLHKMSQHRAAYLQSKNVDLGNKESAQSAWKSFLSRWGVDSAKQLTHEQAEQVLAELYAVSHANDPLAQKLGGSEPSQPNPEQPKPS